MVFLMHLSLLPKKTFPEIVSQTVWAPFEYLPSKSITRPEVELQPHLALQQDFFQERDFKRKYSCARYLLNIILGTFLSCMMAVI